jgi:amino acid transporter
MHAAVNRPAAAQRRVSVSGGGDRSARHRKRHAITETPAVAHPQPEGQGPQPAEKSAPVAPGEGFGLPVAIALLVLVGLWVPAVINMTGVKNMGSVQMVTTVLKFVALAFMSIVGLFYIKSANFTPWNVSGQSAIGAIGSGMAIALFSDIGVEVASVAAGKVRDPDRNVPKSTVFGTLATAVVYMLSLTAVFGIVPSSELAKSNAPFSTAVNTMFGGTWAGYVMSVVIIFGFGALNGWTMICAEMPLRRPRTGFSPIGSRACQRTACPSSASSPPPRWPRSRWPLTTLAPAAQPSSPRSYS